MLARARAAARTAAAPRGARRLPKPSSQRPVAPPRAAAGGPADGAEDEFAKLREAAETDALIDRLAADSGVPALPPRLCGPDPTRSRPCGVAAAQLLAAAPGEDRVAVVRENILTFDPSFFLRIAARADTAEAAERDAMVALAGEVMTMLDKIVTETEKRSDKSGDTLTAIVASAAEADGQFQVPLSDAAVERMRAAVAEASTAGTLDEGVVGNAYAWIRKASEDNLDGMVVILQRVLQLYAQSEMPAEGGAPEAELIDAIVAADEEKWTQMLESGLKGEGAIDADSFFKSLQGRMERTVLTAGTGTFSQRVQAEYLKEIESRANAVLGREQPAE
eukprot:PRCOL_00000952-RA